MKSEPKLEHVVAVAALLEENIDVASFNAALQELEMNPALMASLMSVQFVKDALHGNPCLDKQYTARILRYVAAAEKQRIDDEKSDE